jgi:hypothetical protein
MLVFSGAVTAEEARSTMEKTIPVKVDLPTLSPSPATPRSQPPAAAPSGSASPPLPAPEPAPPTPPPAPEPTPPDPHAGETP